MAEQEHEQRVREARERDRKRRLSEEHEPVDYRSGQAQMRVAEGDGDVSAAVLAVAALLREQVPFCPLPPGYRGVWVFDDGTTDETPIVAIWDTSSGIEHVELRRHEGFCWKEAPPHLWLAPGEELDEADVTRVLEKRKAAQP